MAEVVDDVKYLHVWLVNGLRSSRTYSVLHCSFWASTRAQKEGCAVSRGRVTLRNPATKEVTPAQPDGLDVARSTYGVLEVTLKLDGLALGATGVVVVVVGVRCWDDGRGAGCRSFELDSNC